MKIYPYYSLTITSGTSVPQLIEHMKKHVETNQTFFNTLSANKKLGGKISERGFEIYRIDRMRSFFYICGRFIPIGNKTEIAVQMVLDPYLPIFLALWSAASLLIFLMLLCFRPSYSLITVGLMLFFPWLMSHGIFWSELERSKLFLLRAVGYDENTQVGETFHCPKCDKVVSKEDIADLKCTNCNASLEETKNILTKDISKSDSFAILLGVSHVIFTAIFIAFLVMLAKTY
jgi:hypothetical protein